MFALRCDYRENRGGCIITRLQELRAAGAVIAPERYELVNMVMTTGDYAILCGGYILLIERKTWEDLAASIKDKRIFNNHKKMLDARTLGYRIMYLIEGRAPTPENTSYKVSGIPMGNMMAKLDHFAMRDGAWIEYTRTPAQTAQRLLELGKHMLTLDAAAPQHLENKVEAIPQAISAPSQSATPTTGGSAAASEQKENDIVTNPAGALAPVSESSVADSGTAQLAAPAASAGLNEHAAVIRVIADPEAIIQKKYTRSIAQVREDMIVCVPGIGEKTARNLLNAHPFANIVTFTGISGLSSFQSSELQALAAGQRVSIVAAMLSKVKGISAPIAQLIANAFPVARLAKRDAATTKAIADLKNASGRRLGNALAERISESWSDPLE